jgi:predicted amidohydrolase YtcJ
MDTAPALLLRSARLVDVVSAKPASEPVDLLLERGRVTQVAPRLSASEVQEVDLEGRFLMPGLNDNHLHFTLWSRHRARTDLSGAASAAEAVRVVAEVLATAPTMPGPIVARAFQDALWPDAPTAQALDELCRTAGQPDRAIVLISHDLHSVWINTAAAARYGVPYPGLVTEDAAFVVEQAVDRESDLLVSDMDEGGGQFALIAAALRAAHARGLTQMTDLEMADTPATWAERFSVGLDTMRVRAGVYPEHWTQALARGERTGTVVPGTRGLLSVGPLKVFADGSLGTRTALCHEPYGHPAGHGFAAHDEAGLVELLTLARARGFEVALHAIGDLAVHRALNAFETSGAVGSIEHAQLLADADLPRFAQLGIVASIQPEHALDDRLITDSLWQDRADRAFAYGALAAAGADLRLGSDAPVADLDPWHAISAAVARTRDDLPPWHPRNGLTLSQALAASTVFPVVTPGVDADLAVTEVDPAVASGPQLRSMPVAATIVGGRLVFSGDTGLAV